MDYRRLVKIEDNSGNTVGFLRVKGSAGGVELGISIIEKLPPCRFLLFDGKNYCVISDGIFLSGVDLSYGFCVAAVINGGILAKARYGYEFSEEGFIEFEKNCEKKEAYDKLSENEVFYDDFKVAEENYYEKERGINEKQSVNHDDFEKEYRKGGQGEGNKIKTKPYETDPCNGEKSSYKPVIDEFSAVEGDTVLRKGEYHRGKRYEFWTLTAGKTRVYPLDGVIFGTEFYKMGEDKFYLFGILETASLPAYFIYAVPAERGRPPKGFEKAFFIPQDFFNPKVGYYCLFQKHPETGDK